MTRSVLDAEALVIAFLERELTERNLKPGAKLPTEREVAQRSGQSRATVRRALEVWESQGRVVRHVGKGTFLAPASPPRSPGAEGASPTEIMNARLLVEPQVITVACTAGTPADFVEVERCLRGGDAAYVYAEFELWDSALHRAVASATHNTVLIQIAELINERRHHPLWGNLKRRGFSPERREQYQSDHHKMAAALIDRDPDAAGTLMREHLLHVRRDILGEPL